MARKKGQKATGPAVKVYEVKTHEQPKRRFDGYIKHPWYLVAGAAIAGAIVGAIFFWRKRR